MKDETAELVARAKAGDEEAFGLLVESHSRDVFRLAYRLTGSRENADDVVQEAFLRAYRSLHRFDSRSRFGTWLHRITVNCAMDHLRRSKREASRREPGDQSILERQVSDDERDRLATVSLPKTPSASMSRAQAALLILIKVSL